MAASVQRFYLKSGLQAKDTESALIRADLVFRDLVRQLNAAKVPILVLPGDALPTGIQYGQPIIDMRTGIPVLQSWDGAKLVTASANITNFPDLNDVPSSYSGFGSYLVGVKSSEDGLEFVGAVNSLIGLTDFPASFSGQAGKGVKVNGGETAMEFYTLPTVLSTLIGHTDFPSSYTSQALKFCRVNSGATAIEFFTAALTDLSDFPSYSGNALKHLRVNSGATAVECVSPPVDLLKQEVRATSATWSTCSTAVPDDDTIPQNTEGDEILTQAFTPTDAASTIVIDVTIPYVYLGAAQIVTAALFVDTTASALSAGSCKGASGDVKNITFRYAVSAASTSARTYKLRVGPDTGSAYLNGDSSSRKLGGILEVSMKIKEV